MLTQRTDISELPVWEFTLNNLYDRFILPALENKKTGHFLTDWNKIQSNLESETIKRCSYEAYELIKKSKAWLLDFVWEYYDVSDLWEEEE